jgi:hypothetical protein
MSVVMTQKNSTADQTSPQDINKAPPKINVGSIGAVVSNPRSVGGALDISIRIKGRHKGIEEQEALEAAKKERLAQEDQAHVKRMIENGFPVPREVKLDGPVEIRKRGQKPGKLSV